MPEPDAGSTRTLVVGGGGIVLLGAGWFVLSHVVMGTDIPDALGEALGVMLALAVVGSIAGALLSGRGKPR
jgi:cation transporter-like permease